MPKPSVRAVQFAPRVVGRLLAVIILVATRGAPSPALAQGRCIRAYGTPAC